MRGFGRALPLAALAAASLVFVLGGCAAPETVQRDIHVKRGVTLEDDLIHFYGAPSQRIIRGESEYFVYNGRTMNITSADGTSCHGTPVFIFSYDTKRLSDLKCRENIPAEELSSKAGDSIVVGVTDSGSAPMYDASSQDASGADIGLGAAWRERTRRRSRGLRAETMFPWRTSGRARTGLTLFLRTLAAALGQEIVPLQRVPVMKSHSRERTARWRSSTGNPCFSLSALKGGLRRVPGLFSGYSSGGMASRGSG